MTYAPASITALAKVYTDHGGVNLGIVGNTAHTVGYHLGRDRIYDGSGPGLGDGDYSVVLSRDKAGLTNAASALDIGKLNGSLTELQAFSRWLVQRAIDGATGTKDIREIIYSPDGVYVKRWSGVDGKVYTSLRKNADGSISVITPGNGDASHLWHTHISFYRDSENRDKTGLFAPYFAPLHDTATGDNMPDLSSYLPGYTATVKATSNIRSEPLIASGNVLRVIPSSSTEQWTIIGWVKGGIDPESGSDQWTVRWNGKWEYTAKVNLISGPTAPVSTPPADTTPYAQSDIDAAVAKATAPLQSTIDTQAATIASQKTALATANAEVEDYEALKTALKKAVV